MDALLHKNSNLK